MKAAALFAVGTALISSLTLLTAAPPNFPDLSSYQMDDAMLMWLRPHTNPAATVRHRWTNLMTVTSIHKGGTVALEYFTGEKGENYSHRNAWFAMQNTQGTNLNPAQMNRLRGLLRELPATNAIPPIDRLVLLSHRDNTNWITRAFDNGHRPKALQEIFEVIGERWDEYGKPPPR